MRSDKRTKESRRRERKRVTGSSCIVEMGKGMNEQSKRASVFHDIDTGSSRRRLTAGEQKCKALESEGNKSGQFLCMDRNQWNHSADSIQVPVS
ncbi:hypothetical protein R1flu_009955 [Riccia fluitans]|uniref:Uncharacterized protein n=1 Tax=Riccia fluitans TaxID=41844 RepID=A0ABD1Z3R4_9MARC